MFKFMILKYQMKTSLKDVNVLHMIVIYTAAGIVGNQELDLYLESLNPY